MAFKGVNPEVQAKINSWRLPSPVIRRFAQELQHLEKLSPLILASDSEGLFYTIDIDDAVDPRAGYIFDVRIRRNDVDFWVADINALEVNGNQDIIWSSDDTTP